MLRCKWPGCNSRIELLYAYNKPDKKRVRHTDPTKDAITLGGHPACETEAEVDRIDAAIGLLKSLVKAGSDSLAITPREWAVSMDIVLWEGES